MLRRKGANEMRFGNRWVVFLALAGLPLSGCAGTVAEAESSEHAAKIEQIKGSDLNRVILIPRAAERLGIQTAPVRETGAGRTTSGTQRKVIPYSSVLYDPQGRTWTYTNPERLTYVRHRIRVVSITGVRAIVSAGPPAGTRVVTVGAAELYGAEYGVGH